MKMKISLSSVSFISAEAPRVFAADGFPRSARNRKEEKNYSRAVLLCAFPEMKTSRKSVEALMVSMRWSFLFWWLRLDGVRDDMRSGHQTTASDKCTSLNKSSLRARRRCVEISFEISSVIPNRFPSNSNQIFSRGEIFCARPLRKAFPSSTTTVCYGKYHVALRLSTHTQASIWGKQSERACRRFARIIDFISRRECKSTSLPVRSVHFPFAPKIPGPEFNEFIHLVTHCEWTIKWMNFFPLWPRFFFLAFSRLSPMV